MYFFSNCKQRGKTNYSKANAIDYKEINILYKSKSLNHVLMTNVQKAYKRNEKYTLIEKVLSVEKNIQIYCKSHPFSYPFGKSLKKVTLKTYKT